MLSESLVENLFREIEWIIARTKVIKISIKGTKNNKLKIRLKKEFSSLTKRLGNIQTISFNIYKITKDPSCLSALLVEKCKRTEYELHNSKELFFT